MDIMSILGWLLGFGLVAFGIVYDVTAGAAIWENLIRFYDLPSIFITIGGTFCALMISYPLSNFAKIFKHLRIVLRPPKYDPQAFINEIVEYAKEARMKGLLSLEDKLNTSDTDPFLKDSLMLVVDSVEPEKVKELLEAEIDYLDDRHGQDISFYERGAAFGPAFGMIGTLIGLINMLQEMDDPAAIGPAMSVALVTTFYGSMLANLFFLPMASKLKVRHEEEILCKMIVCEGVQAIQAGENPRFIGEKLTRLLPRYKQSKVDSTGESETTTEEKSARKSKKAKK